MPIVRFFWDEQSPIYRLLAAAALVMLVMLGSSLLWTHEGRWATICHEMMRTGDYLHPTLLDQPYYDKPLLSYWMMVALARLLGGLSEWALRLPGVAAGVVAVWCTIRIGRALFDRPTALLAGGILASGFFFVFWSRLACADLLSLAGTLAGVAWYFERRDKPGFTTSSVFFLILAVSALMKGLIAPVIDVLVLIPDLLQERRWRRHLRWTLPLSIFPGVALYVLPFLLSSLFGGEGYGHSGFERVIRENVVRYFWPFDHTGPVYTYALSLPLFMLPWTAFLIPAAVGALRRWKTLDASTRWALWACALIFVFLTAGGSRRDYYILPILPFCALVTARWIASGERRRSIAGWTAAVSWVLMILWFGVGMPYTTSLGGPKVLAGQVRSLAERRAEWKEWTLVVYSGPPSVPYYFESLSQALRFDLGQTDRLCDFLDRHPRTIVVTRVEYIEQVRPAFRNATILQEIPPMPEFLWSARAIADSLVVFVPP